MCSTSNSLHYKWGSNCVAPYVIEEPRSAMLNFRHMTQKVRFSCKTFSSSVDSCSPLLYIHILRHGGPGSIPGGVRNFNSYPGIGCVSFVCVLFCVVSGGGSDIVLTTHSGRPPLVYLSSILVHRQLLPLQASHPRAFGFQVPGV